MIVMWLVEIYLNMLSHHGANKKHVDEEDEEAAEDAFNDQTSRELLSLMRQPKVSECIANNRNTFYDLLSCHGDKVRHLSDICSCFLQGELNLLFSRLYAKRTRFASYLLSKKNLKKSFNCF